VTFTPRNTPSLPSTSRPQLERYFVIIYFSKVLLLFLRQYNIDFHWISRVSSFRRYNLTLKRSYTRTLRFLSDDLKSMNNREYSFKNQAIQEVVYQIMLFSQRRQLHKRIAEWYERTQADNLSNFSRYFVYYYYYYNYYWRLRDY
jgi:L-arabinose isomerase